MIQCLKERPVRDPGYLRLVASLPCVWCGRQGPSQAAHANRGKGMGIKASDAQTFPLCATRPMALGCHDLFDQGSVPREERRRLEVLWAERTRTQLRQIAEQDESVRRIVVRSIGP